MVPQESGPEVREPRPAEHAWRRLWLTILAGTLAAGAAAGTLTVNGMDAPAAASDPSRTALVEVAASTAPSASPADQGSSWAVQAFQAGLRQCPQGDEAFQAACQAEMKTLAAAAAAPMPAWLNEAQPVRSRPATAWAWHRTETADAAPAFDEEATRPATPVYACYGCDRNAGETGAEGPADDNAAEPSDPRFADAQ